MPQNTEPLFVVIREFPAGPVAWTGRHPESSTETPIVVTADEVRQNLDSLIQIGWDIRPVTLGEPMSREELAVALGLAPTV